MKRILHLLLTAITLSLLTMNISNAQNKDSKGHSLPELWKAYDKAVSADRPKDQLAALEKIKAAALKSSLAWDYYDACSKYVGARTSTNWKLREQAEADFRSEMENCGIAAARFFYHIQNGEYGTAAQIFHEMPSELERSCNPEFHSRDGAINSRPYSDALLPLLENDRDYALWALWLRNGEEFDAEISSRYSGEYPFAQFMEYTVACRLKDPDRHDCLKGYAARYKGKAVALFAEQDLLRDRFSELCEGNGTSAQFEALREDCIAFIAARKKFSGSEKAIAACCKEPDNLKKTLEEESLGVMVEDGSILVEMRNLTSADLCIQTSKSTIWETRVSNGTKSFYKPDTVKVAVPRNLDDGEYTVVCSSGSNRDQTEYTRYTLSIATKQDSRGYAVYVADYKTGQPSKMCTVTLFDKDGKKLSSEQGIVCTDGFAYLPESFTGKIRTMQWRNSFQASYTDAGGALRLSPKHFIYAERFSLDIDDKPDRHCEILTDRTAFTPGETVHFKAVLYEGTYEYKVRGEGVSLTARLLDPKGDVVEEKSLKTNEFGSVAGDFVLKKSDRGGTYRIILLENGRTVAVAWMTVDEFVLPSYGLKWDGNTRIWLPSEEVAVSGTVSSYSGRSLEGMTVNYKVSKYGATVASGSLSPDRKGRFCIKFDATADDWAFYRISATTVDSTGETLEFNTSAYSGYNIPLEVEVLNTVKGDCDLSGSRSEIEPGFTARPWQCEIVGADSLRLAFNIQGRGGESLTHPSLKISYRLKLGAKTVLSGSAKSGQTLDLDLSGLSSGHYHLLAEATVKGADGKPRSSKVCLNIIKASENDDALDASVDSFFREVDCEDGIALQVGSTTGRTWAVVELYGSGNVLLERQMLQLKGERGLPGSLATVRYPYREGYPSSLSLKVLWFKNSGHESYTCEKTHTDPAYALPLSFTRFVDMTSPRTPCSLLVQTVAGVECAATVFDAATETVHGNRWHPVTPTPRPAPTVSYTESCGREDSNLIVIGYGMSGGRTKAMALNSIVEENLMTCEAVPDMAMPGDAPEDDGIPAAAVRDNFASTIAWEPFLRSDGNGRIGLDFTTTDKLSKFYVQLFAHDTRFHNAVIRREMTVTLPVQVSIVEPQFLYEGDTYTANVSLSNSLGKQVPGKWSVKFFSGTDWKNSKPLAESKGNVQIPAGGASGLSAEIKLPSGIDTLGVLASFTALNREYGSDAVFVAVPVKTPVQAITEAHSAILRSAADRAALERELRSMFVNSDGSLATAAEISIRKMLYEAVPEKIEPASSNALDVSEALYSRWLLEQMRLLVRDKLSSDAELRSRLAACQSSTSGGIAWFEGFECSPVVTAVVLERFAAMGGAEAASEAGLDPEAAVRFLDLAQLGGRNRPIWCGGLSLGQYMHVRSLYAQYPFPSKDLDSKALKEFKTDAKEYLTPSRDRGLEGRILEKARRLRTLRNLCSCAAGEELAKAWGLSIRKLGPSVAADVESLLQYAEPHSCGGVYYPNAVMPFRGLLENEAYAHSLLCDLLSDCGHTDTADGIRLWLMLQKETQEWTSQSGYLDALRSVFHGSDDLLATKVLTLSASTEIPFPEVRKSGNGFTVSRIFLRDGAVLSEGDVLQVGDKITAKYEIWNAENRSFVRLTAPRPACLRPADQLSGRYGWWLSPLRTDGWYTFTPQGYRSVLSDATQYWFDSYPEEKTTVTEEFFVTQEGSFSSPAVFIESLYAPHYRANDDGCSARNVK